MVDKNTAHVVLMFVSWIEFVLGGRITDYLGTNSPLNDRMLKYLEKFEKVLKIKSIDDIKEEDIW